MSYNCISLFLTGFLIMKVADCSVYKLWKYPFYFNQLDPDIPALENLVNVFLLIIWLPLFLCPERGFSHFILHTSFICFDSAVLPCCNKGPDVKGVERAVLLQCSAHLGKPFAAPVSLQLQVSASPNPNSLSQLLSHHTMCLSWTFSPERDIIESFT